MFRNLLVASAVMAMAGVASAETGTHASSLSRGDRVVFAPVGSARTLVPVHVARSSPNAAGPYALTGRVKDAPRMTPIFIGSRFVGMRQGDSGANRLSANG